MLVTWLGTVRYEKQLGYDHCITPSNILCLDFQLVGKMRYAYVKEASILLALLLFRHEVEGRYINLHTLSRCSFMAAPWGLHRFDLAFPSYKIRSPHIKHRRADLNTPLHGTMLKRTSQTAVIFSAFVFHILSKIRVSVIQSTNLLTSSQSYDNILERLESCFRLMS